MSYSKSFLLMAVGVWCFAASFVADYRDDLCIEFGKRYGRAELHCGGSALFYLGLIATIALVLSAASLFFKVVDQDGSAGK